MAERHPISWAKEHFSNNAPDHTTLLRNARNAFVAVSTLADAAAAIEYFGVHNVPNTLGLLVGSLAGWAYAGRGEYLRRAEINKPPQKVRQL